MNELDELDVVGRQEGANSVGAERFWYFAGFHCLRSHLNSTFFSERSRDVDIRGDTGAKAGIFCSGHVFQGIGD